MMNPKIDLIFKKLFGSEENKDILLSLINAILPDEQQIKELALKNPYNVSDYAEGKLSILDIKAEDEKGDLYDIEMQIKGNTFYGRRTLYYWAKIYGSQLDDEKIKADEKIENIRKKKSYSELNKCIVISLMNFEFFEDNRYHRCFMLKDRETSETHADLNYLDLYFVELEKFETKYQGVKTVLDRWIAFLNNADRYSRENLPAELAEIASIKKANEKLSIMYLDKKERGYYESQQKWYLDEISRIQEALHKGLEEGFEKRGREEGLEKGREEGLEKGREQAAINAMLEGANNEFVAKITGLNLERVEDLRKDIKKSD